MTTPASQDSFGEFDEVLDRSELSAVKWEMEFDRLGRKDLFSFGTADMDFRSPAAIGSALERVARVGHFGYPYKSASYYEAIIGFYQRNFGWTVQREWISHSTGVYPSMRPLIDRLSSIGDEVIYQSPVHFQFRNIIAANGRIPVANPLKLNNGRYEMDFEHLSRSVTPRTRLLLLCNPHNPVGRAWSRDELARLAEFCTKHRIIVLTDELYCGLLHEGATYTPYASVSEEALMNSVTLTSATKMFNLTGLKHSQVIAANPLLMATYLEGFKQDASGYGGSMFGQAAAEVAYRDCDDWLKRLMHYIAGNLQFATSYFEQHLPEVIVHPMESTYFMWLDFSRLGLSDLEMRHLFKDKHGLVLNYGVDLGPGGEGHIRLNIATQRIILEQGLKRISDALK